VLPRQLDAFLREVGQIWRHILQVDVLLPHIAMHEQEVLKVLDYLDGVNRLFPPVLLIDQQLFPLINEVLIDQAFLLWSFRLLQ
jgi:hypothetical protein